MPAEAGTWIERHKAEGLGGGRVDHFPNVDVHAIAHQRHFIHQAGVTPPTTFGMLSVWNRALPGSTRSGEKHRKKSRPTLKSGFSSICSSSSSVVPGYVVDSRMTRRPGCAYSAIFSVAATMKLMSGSLVFRNGVGTQMLIVSSSEMIEKSVVAVSLPASTRGF